MKNRQLWLVIACILVIGAVVTRYTRSYVTREPKAAQTVEQQETAALPGETGEETGTSGSPGGEEEPAPVLAAAGETAETAGEDRAAIEAEESRETGGDGRAALRALPAGEETGAPAPAAAESGQETLPETALAGAPPAAEKLPASPLEGVEGRAVALGQKPGDGDVRGRLEELDKQIGQLRGQEEDSNIYSIKITAESELSLWEGEMNAVYNSLLEVLPKDEGERLAAEQQEWLKNSSSKALEQLRLKDSAATIRSAGYASALAALTRERAYELAGRYERQTGTGEEAEPEEGFLQETGP